MSTGISIFNYKEKFKFLYSLEKEKYTHIKNYLLEFGLNESTHGNWYKHENTIPVEYENALSLRFDFSLKDSEFWRNGKWEDFIIYFEKNCKTSRTDFNKPGMVEVIDKLRIEMINRSKRKQNSNNPSNITVLENDDPRRPKDVVPRVVAMSIELSSQTNLRDTMTLYVTVNSSSDSFSDSLPGDGEQSGLEYTYLFSRLWLNLVTDAKVLRPLGLPGETSALEQVQLHDGAVVRFRGALQASCHWQMTGSEIAFQRQRFADLEGRLGGRDRLELRVGLQDIDIPALKFPAASHVKRRLFNHLIRLAAAGAPDPDGLGVLLSRVPLEESTR